MNMQNILQMPFGSKSDFCVSKTYSTKYFSVSPQKIPRLLL